MNIEATRNDLTSTINANRDFLCGGEDAADVAEFWLVRFVLANNLDATIVDAWINAGVFDAEAANELHRAGFTPSQIRRSWRPGVSAGYAYTSGEASLGQLRQRFNVEA
jgi:hypothetical protein